MEDWKETTIGEIADVQTGPFGSQLHEKDYVLKGTPIVTVEHLGLRKFKTQNLPLVSDEDKNRLSKYILNQGDLVFSRVGSVDRCTYTSKENDGWLFSGRCLRVRPNSEIDSMFLYYCFNLESTKQYIRNIAVGATMPSINTSLMCEVPVKFPPLPTQQKIAAILSSLDDKIELNNKINANLEQQAQALFKNWFVDFAPFGGEMPAGWKMGKLSNVAEITSGKRPPMKQSNFEKNVSIPLVGAASVMGFTNQVLYNEPILVTGRVGTHGIIQRFSTECWPSDNTLVVKSKYYEFTYQVMKNIDYKNMNRGSTQPLITQSDLGKVECLIPDSENLIKFEAIAGDFFKKIAANEIENKKLSSIRDTLLPKLMNGEINI